ncbi:MAG: transcriptional repressor [Dokdonella sp.]|uniref:transcriptional repressor n=1 Tax=Dokdonella sp. TaxID=2291710 RepID=UPI0032643C31
MTSASNHRHTHHDHPHDADGFVETVSSACEMRGLRLTPLRLRVLELIAAESKPVKAYDLLDRLKDEHTGAAPPTVYRALDFLLEHRFIHKLESINAFVGCHHPDEVHQVPFLICDVCSNAIEICDERVSSLLGDQARERGFAPRAQTIEVHGVCASCHGEPAGKARAS